jgi:hypothetical protein
MEKLLAILALMDKYKVEISEYIQWANENKGLLNAEELERLHSRNVEIEKIIERLHKIINDEVEAYKVQFIFDPNTVPGYPSQISKISDITKAYVKEIVYNEGRKLYDVLPMDDYNASMTLEELTKHQMSRGLIKGLSNDEWEVYKKVRFLDFLKDDKINIGVKNYLTFGIKLFFFIMCFVMFSCNSYKIATGMYFNIENKLGLQLYPDSTFTIGIRYSSNMISFVRNCGIYEIKKDKLILHSHNKYQDAALKLEINATKIASDSVSIIYSIWTDALIKYACVPLYFSDNGQDYEMKFNQRVCMKDTIYLVNKELQSLKIKTIGERDSNIYCLDIDNNNEFTIRAERFNNENHTIFFDSLVFEKKGAAYVNDSDRISLEGTTINDFKKYIIPGKLTKKLKDPDGSIQSINRYITAIKTNRFLCN